MAATSKNASGKGKPLGPYRRRGRILNGVTVLRPALGLTQEQAARRMGISRTTLVAIELGQRKTPLTADQLAMLRVGGNDFGGELPEILERLQKEQK